jgi:hypothetical protein
MGDGYRECGHVLLVAVRVLIAQIHCWRNHLNSFLQPFAESCFVLAILFGDTVGHFFKQDVPPVTLRARTRCKFLRRPKHDGWVLSTRIRSFNPDTFTLIRHYDRDFRQRLSTVDAFYYLMALVEPRGER